MDHMESLNDILKKPAEARTAEESDLLKQSPDIVQSIEKRKKIRSLTKERLQESEDPPELLRKKCVELARVIKNAKSLVVYTGAGISTAASIPDYRGPNGVWTLLQQGIQPKAQDLTLAEPTYTHMALSLLHRLGRIKYMISQNCDGLHVRSGVPPNALSELHGNMFIEVCRKCWPVAQHVRLFDVTERTGVRRHRTGRHCHQCNGELNDTIVHFGEKGDHGPPHNWEEAAEAVDRADVILCLGSSLKVLRRYPCLWSMHKDKDKRPQLYIINLQWTPKDDVAALKLNGRCDEVMRMAMTELGLIVPNYDRCYDPLFAMSAALKSEELSSHSKLVLQEPKNYKCTDIKPMLPENFGDAKKKIGKLRRKRRKAPAKARHGSGNSVHENADLLKTEKLVAGKSYNLRRKAAAVQIADSNANSKPWAAKRKCYATRHTLEKPELQSQCELDIKGECDLSTSAKTLKHSKRSPRKCKLREYELKNESADNEIQFEVKNEPFGAQHLSAHLKSKSEMVSLQSSSLKDPECGIATNSNEGKYAQIHRHNEANAKVQNPTDTGKGTQANQTSVSSTHVGIGAVTVTSSLKEGCDGSSSEDAALQYLAATGLLSMSDSAVTGQFITSACGPKESMSDVQMERESACVSESPSKLGGTSDKMRGDFPSSALAPQSKDSNEPQAEQPDGKQQSPAKSASGFAPEQTVVSVLASTIQRPNCLTNRTRDSGSDGCPVTYVETPVSDLPALLPLHLVRKSNHTKARDQKNDNPGECVGDGVSRPDSSSPPALLPLPLRGRTPSQKHLQSLVSPTAPVLGSSAHAVSASNNSEVMPSTALAHTGILPQMLQNQTANPDKPDNASDLTRQLLLQYYNTMCLGIIQYAELLRNGLVPPVHGVTTSTATTSQPVGNSGIHCAEKSTLDQKLFHNVNITAAISSPQSLATACVPCVANETTRSTFGMDAISHCSATPPKQLPPIPKPKKTPSRPTPSQAYPTIVNALLKPQKLHQNILHGVDHGTSMIDVPEDPIPDDSYTVPPGLELDTVAMEVTVTASEDLPSDFAVSTAGVGSLETGNAFSIAEEQATDSSQPIMSPSDLHGIIAMNSASPSVIESTDAGQVFPQFDLRANCEHPTAVEMMTRRMREFYQTAESASLESNSPGVMSSSSMQLSTSACDASQGPMSPVSTDTIHTLGNPAEVLTTPGNLCGYPAVVVEKLAELHRQQTINLSSDATELSQTSELAKHLSQPKLSHKLPSQAVDSHSTVAPDSSRSSPSAGISSLASTMAKEAAEKNVLTVPGWFGKGLALKKSKRKKSR